MRAAFVRLGLCALIAAVTACHSTSPSGTGSGSFTATLDGVNWASAASLITVSGANSVVPGSIIISGTQTSGTSTISVSLLLGYIPGVAPPSLPFGVNQATTAGGTGLVQSTTSSTFANWSTGFSGAAGTVSITGITSSQISGTFQFTAPPQLGQTGASKVVTNGKFTVPLSGFVVAPASTPGSVVTASLGGSPFNAATITGTAAPVSFLGTSTSATNVTSSVDLIMSGTIVAGTSYPLTTPQGGGSYASILVTVGSSSFGGASGDSGSVFISSISGGRASGTFSGTLSGGLSVTGGTFNVKIQ